MKLKKKNTKYTLIGCLLLIIISSFMLKSFLLTVSVHKMENININPSDALTFNKQWVNNSNFDSDDFWFNETNGDFSDVKTTYENNEANYVILGSEGNYIFYEEPPLNDGSWIKKYNPDFPYYPDIALINQTGMCVSHYWDEGADQSVSVNWDKNVTLPTNISDYEITSASIKAVVNGSVHVPSYQPYSDGIEAGNDLGTNTTQYATGDYARFYVLISDINKNNVYEIAYNQTTNLGQDSPEIATMGDTTMLSISEESLIFFLSSVLSSDFQNFTITLGMRIWCEDNYPQDSDWWKLLVIKSVNLTFSYEKKIDKETSISWNQDCESITKDISIENYLSFRVDKAILNFSYKSVPLWPENSPNSEFRIILNGQIHRVKIELKNVGESWETANLDVAYLINDDVNISIQLYIADTFRLNNIVQVSIDNMTLDITYTVFTEDPKPTDWRPIIYALIGVIGTLIIGFVTYQTYFKYPPVVRKVRKLRKKIAKGKTPRSLKKIKDRKIITKNIQEKQIMDIAPKENENPTLIK
ncbi:MAG: hypothetical protein ACQERB_02465 [Promethearchaeati archaeon]